MTALAVLVFVFWRLWGPGIVVVRDSAVDSIIQDGDIIWAEPQRQESVVGDLVLVATSDQQGLRLPDFLARDGIARPSPLTLRQVVAVSGDTVNWSLTHVTVRHPDGSSSRYSLRPLHEALEQGTRRASVSTGSVFLLADDAGIADSRVLGPVNHELVLYRATRILWPADRRRRLTPLESERLSR